MSSSDQTTERYEAWTTCERHARPFREVRMLAPELRVPPSLWLALLVFTTAGFGVGFSLAGGLDRSPWAFGSFCAAATSYTLVVALDLNEHFRLERFVTGRYMSWQVIPLWESALHIGIVGSLGIAVVVAFQGPLWGNGLLLLSTLAFFGLGWVDELLYHRRRALHREDILHTVSHLTGGAVFATLFLSV